MVAWQIWIFFIWVWWFYGWVEHGDVCLKWFTSVYKWRSAGTDRAIHNPLAPSQNHSWAQTPVHKHTSTHTAAGRTAVTNICRGHTPTRQCPSTLCVHFSGESTLAKGRINPPVLQMQSNEPTKNTHMATISVSPRQFLLHLSSLSVSSRKYQLLWSHTRRKTQDLHTELYSMNQLWSQWPTNLLDNLQDAAHNCFLSLALFNRGLISGAEDTGYNLLFFKNHIHKQYYNPYN